MNEILDIFKKEFFYINREESTIKEILSDKDNYFIEKRDEGGNLIAVSIINKNTILFFYVDKNYRNNGVGTELLTESEIYIKNNGYKSVIIGEGVNYLMPGIPTSKKYFDSVNECLIKGVDDTASKFFEKKRILSFLGL